MVLHYDLTKLTIKKQEQESKNKESRAKNQDKGFISMAFFYPFSILSLVPGS